jgi:hypothetical protein
VLFGSNLGTAEGLAHGIAEDADPATIRTHQMVKILAAVLTDGLLAVEAACLQALTEGVHSADVVINILARQRDPGPAATIMTPDALRLRHAPIADCARQDQLRSA